MLPALCEEVSTVETAELEVEAIPEEETGLEDDGLGVPEVPAGLLEEGELECPTGVLREDDWVGTAGVLDGFDTVPLGVMALPELDWAGLLECEGELEGVAVGETTGVRELEVCSPVEEVAAELEGTLG